MTSRTLKIVYAALFVLALAWQQIEATRLGYAVEKSRKQEHILRGRIGAVQLELERSLSPSQLALQARSRLGMQPASPDALRILGDGAEAPAELPFFRRLMSWGGRMLPLPRAA
jgi:hypothetical protein